MQHDTQLRILDDLLAKLEAGTTCDAGRQLLNPTEVYTCPDLAAREWTAFFREHPQIVGLSADLPAPGAFLTCDDFGVPLLLTRDADGNFRAFVNACRHRATRLTDDARGHAKRFTCPFHGWTYAADGRLTGVPEEAQFGSVDRDCHGLMPMPAVEACGLLFVHPQPHGIIDVDALIGPLRAELDSWDLGNRVYRAGRALEMRMNWKLANDTFGETYHFKRLHRNTLNNLFIGDLLAYETSGRNHRAVFPSRKLAGLRDKPRERWRLDHVATILYYLFPNIQLTVSDRQITLFRIYPRAGEPGRSTTRVSHYFSQEAIDLIESGTKTVIDGSNVYDAKARDGNAIISPDAAMEILDSTVEHEDFQMAESTQRNAEAGLLDTVIFGRNEQPLHHFHQTFREALGLPPLDSA